MHAVIETTGIRYAFDERPAPGAVLPIVRGVNWLHMPLPFSLGHINLWLLDDGDAWSIVDAGVFADETKAVWENVALNLMNGRRLSRVIVTHLHPDHAGAAGWLTDRFDAPLYMSREEYLLFRVLVADTGRATPEEGDRFYTAAGFAGDQLDYYHKMFGMFGRYTAPMPESYIRLKDGDCLQIGAHEWEVIVGRGHSPEHACLHCKDANLLISGDQLLPTISSNVSVFPTEPLANPLADWIESLQGLKSRVPADVLVLPAHGKPFFGAHVRLDTLINEHIADLDKLQVECREPRRAVDVFHLLFKSKIDRNNLIMATGESIAHLNYLLHRGRLEVTRDGDGVDWYRAVSSH